MRVVMISQYFHPEPFSNSAIARELVRRCHEVVAVPCVPNYPAGEFTQGYSNTQKREETWQGVRIFRAFTVARGRTKLSLALNYIVYPFAAAWTMWRKIKERPDVSFVSMPSPLFQAVAGVLLRWRTGTPCVYWVQDIWPESAIFTLNIHNRFARAILNAICGWIYRRADLILVQSEAFPPMITRFGVKPERIRVFPNTAPETYRPLGPEAAPDQAALVPQKGFRLMFAGNIGESQDFDTLIEAAGRLRHREDLTWVIIGSGRDEGRVRQAVADRSLEDRFLFLGRHPEETIPYFFAHADALIVSLRDTPIFALTVPYKVQCYMACGKPIVASLNGEGARIVNASGAGIAAPASNPEALASAIERMIDHSPAERASYGRASLEYFRAHYSQSIVYDILERSLEEAAHTSHVDRAERMSA